jgi:hypothetical protein
VKSLAFIKKQHCREKLFLVIFTPAILLRTFEFNFVGSHFEDLGQLSYDWFRDMINYIIRPAIFKGQKAEAYICLKIFARLSNFLQPHRGNSLWLHANKLYNQAGHFQRRKAEAYT